uniref:hypothetical protein n=1 Tax=uncultured Draconibacterium sp. TaxID=1573823 RepID=UPI003217435D
MKNFTLFLIFSLMAFIGNAQQPTFNWQKDTLSNGNILQKMTINGNNAVIAGYDNTFLLSNDGGENWNSLNMFKPSYDLYDISVTDMVGYVVTSREKLYDAAQDVYTNGIILKTVDGGTTWTTIDGAVFGTENNPATNPLADLCFGLDFSAVETINDTIAYCAARWYEYLPGSNEDHSAVFKTTDGGLNWKNISGDLGGSSMSCIEFNGDTGFTGGSKMLFRTTITADTLVNIYPSFPSTSSPYIYDIDFVSESEVLFTTTRDSILFSNNLGESFTKLKGLSGANDIYKVNDSTIVATSSKKVFVSTDNGSSWDESLTSLTTWEIGGIANDSLILLAKSTLFKCAVSDLLSANYNFTTQSLGDNNLFKVYFNDNNLTIVGKELNFHQSTDGGISWIKKELPEVPSLVELYDNFDFSGLSAVDDEAYACIGRHYLMDYPSSSDKDDVYWSGGIFYTADNWTTYKSVDVAKVGKSDVEDPSVNPNHASCNGVNTSVIHYLGDDVVFLWVRWYDYSTTPKTEHSRVFKSIDAGKNWMHITEDLGNKYVQEIQSKGDTVYIVGKRVLLYSEDAGLKSVETTPTFTDLYPNLDIDEDDDMFINAIELGAENEFFLVTSKDSCFVTTDGGVTFRTIGNIAGANDFYKFDSNSYIMMGTKGAFFTNDGGETWLDCNPGKTIFEIGGIYNDKFYALGISYAYTNDISNFELLTATPTLYSNAELNVFYEPSAVKLVSTEGVIEHCALYSITGKLVSLTEPNSRIQQYKNNEFQPGIYIVNSVVKGKRYINKISIK